MRIASLEHSMTRAVRIEVSPPPANFFTIRGRKQPFRRFRRSLVFFASLPFCRCSHNLRNVARVLSHVHFPSSREMHRNFCHKFATICVHVRGSESIFRDEAGKGCVSSSSDACPLPSFSLFRCFLFGRTISVFSERPFKRLRPKKKCRSN